MQVPFFRRLSFAQARITFIFVCLMALITSVCQIFSDLCLERQETEKTIRQVLQMQEESAALASWSLDPVGADRVITGLLYYPAICAASLTSDAGQILAAAERPVTEAGGLAFLALKIVEKQDFSIDLHVKDKEEIIGTLAIKIDSGSIAASFLKRTVRNILAAVVPLIFLSAFLVWMFHLLLTKPLQHLAAQLAAVDTEQPLKTLLQKTRKHADDELGLIVDSSNRLLTKFEETLAARRATEVRLQVAEKKYRSIVDNAIVGIFQTTFDGKFLAANPALVKMIGFENFEQLTAKITNIGAQLYADQEQRDAMINKLIEDGYAQNVETRVLRRDGSSGWVNQNVRIVRDEITGEPLYIEGSVADITERKKALEDLARVEAQLVQSQKMEALGNLAGGIAHDFNNLLQVISGLVQLILMKKNPTDPDYHYLSEINKAAGRAAELVRRMLTFSRKVEAKKVPLNLNELIVESLTLLERTLPKMITIKTHLDSELPTIPADPNQIEQVIMNLVNNAVQAMADSGTLTIETERFSVESRYINTYLELEPGQYILLKISDTGHGMDESVRQRIFDPFFTTKEKGQGTGLGLSSAYGIISSHDGKITCYSELGVGTTFKIFLPILAMDGVAPAITELERQTGKGGSETILLADDEEPLLTMAADILQQYGYATCQAHSGEEALEVYKQRQKTIDLVILDLGMPGMGGKKCLELLQLLNPKVKVIIASGYGSSEITQNPEQFGAAAFLSKPYRLDALLQTVRGTLDGKPSESQATDWSH